MKYLPFLLFILILVGAGCLLPPSNNDTSSLEEMSEDTAMEDAYLDDIQLATPEDFINNDTIIIYDDIVLSQIESASGFITVDNLVPGEIMPEPLLIEGQANVFENNVQYRVSDQAGQLIYTGFTTANSIDVGEFGSYEIELDMSNEPSGSYLIEVYSESAQDGTEINMVSFWMVK